MVRVAIIGNNCQVGPIYKAVEFLAPRINLDLFSLSQLRKDFKNVGKLAEKLRNFDFVFSPNFEDNAEPSWSSAEFVKLLPNVVFFPMIVFHAFHPDIVYVRYTSWRSKGEFLPSPVGEYHSSIILFGYLQGFTQEQTMGLFSEAFLRRVGFLDAWQPAAKALLSAAERAQLPLDQELIHWSRQGCFMYSINHPRLFVLADVARAMLRRAELPLRDADPSLFVADELMNSAIWPVYPPIAESLGLAGSYCFKKQGASTYYDLDELISGSYEIYARSNKKRLECRRIETWTADQALIDFARGLVN